MNLIFSLIISLFFMGLAWQVHLRTKTHKVAEIVRPLTLLLVGACHLFLQGWSTKSNIALYFLLFWALKQSLFNALPQISNEKLNFYYYALMKSWQMKDNSTLIFYLVQGLYVWILALPFYFIAKQSSYSWIDMLLYTALFFALVLETVANINAYFFQKEQHGNINQQGLWSRCRHPTYFCTWVVWLCFSCLGLYNLPSLLSLFSCLFFYFILRFYLIPASENYMLTIHPIEYAAYKRKVPAFFPKWIG